MQIGNGSWTNFNYFLTVTTLVLPVLKKNWPVPSLLLHFLGINFTEFCLMGLSAPSACYVHARKVVLPTVPLPFGISQ